MPSADQLKKQLLELGILTLATVVIWIAYSVYNVLTQPAQTQVSKEELQPLPKNIDLGQLDQLKQRLIIEEEELNNLEDLENIFSEPLIIEAAPTPDDTRYPEASESSVIQEDGL